MWELPATVVCDDEDKDDDYDNGDDVDDVLVILKINFNND